MLACAKRTRELAPKMMNQREQLGSMCSQGLLERAWDLLVGVGGGVSSRRQGTATRLEPAAPS